MNTKTYFTISFLILVNLNCFSQKLKDEPISFQDDFSINWRTNLDTLKLVAKNKLTTPIEIYFTSKINETELNSFLLPPKDSLVLIQFNGYLPDTTFVSNFRDSIRIGYFFGHKSVITPDLVTNFIM